MNLLRLALAVALSLTIASPIAARDTPKHESKPKHGPVTPAPLAAPAVPGVITVEVNCPSTIVRFTIPVGVNEAVHITSTVSNAPGELFNEQVDTRGRTQPLEIMSLSGQLKPGVVTMAVGTFQTSAMVPNCAIRHVVIVWMENKERSAITASSMPYLYGLSTTYGQSTGMYGVTHPSQPNYIAQWSGSTQGVTTNNPVDLDVPSLSSQMTAAGLQWRAFQQNYPSSGCNKAATYAGGVDGWGVAGTYARKHNPAMSFLSVSGSSTECAKIKPLAAFNPTEAEIAFVTPNLCNDTHDCSLAQGDAFLRAFLPSVFNSPDWAHTLLIVSFDEGSTNTNGGGNVFAMIARQGLSGVTSSTFHNHYGVLRTVEDTFALPCLGSACNAAPLTEFLP